MDKPRKRKPNKQQREQRRKHDADLFNEAFSMGYAVGYKQGGNDVYEQMKRELNKKANYGR